MYSRESCADRRRQPTLKNAERKDTGMLSMQYPKREQRTFRALERPRGL
ncbi:MULTISPECIES: hypothetical protein [unclassified Leifsonia]|nr:MULTISPECIES: hypothetical protein [unclassified Leifsonia]